MVEFEMNLSSINDVKDFVNTVSRYDFDVDLTSGRYVVDAKSIMGIFSLNLSKPIEVEVHSDDCDAFIDELKKDECYLQRVYIKPERQCNRIAQTAILLCEKHFPDINIFYVDFPEDLVKNRRCYERVGFEDTGKRMETEPVLVLACFEKTKII